MGLLPCSGGSCNLVKGCSWVAVPKDMQRVLCPLPVLLALARLVGWDAGSDAHLCLHRKTAVKVTEAGSLRKYR